MELDIDEMAKRLELVPKGRERGTRNEPPTSSQSLDDVEHKITTTIEAEKKIAHEKLLENLRTYGDRIRSLGFQTRFAQLQAAADNARASFRACVHQGVDLLFELRRDVVRIEAEVEQFKDANGLKRMSHHPRSRTLRWGFICIIILLESILNGVMLARGHELGYFGGIGEAFVISLINVLVGLFAGWKVFTQVAHRRWWRKLVGAAGSLCFFAFAIGANLLVAHYREALGGDAPEQAARLAVSALKADSFAIAEAQSWFLFALGLFFSLAAAMDGFIMDDRYPGYGALARRQEELIAEYVAQKKDLMKELEKVRDEAIQTMEDAARDVEYRRAEYHAIQESRTKLKRAFGQHLDYLEHCANDLLTTYREENRRNRKTEEPARFSRRWTLSRFADPEFGFEGYAGDAELEREIGQTFAALAERRQEVLKDYNDAIEEYRRIEDLTPEALNGPLRPPSP
jgi:hypothetical protein